MPVKVFPHVPSGAKTLDKMLSKGCPGFPRGRMSEVSGPPGSGKTVLMLSSALEVSKLGGTTYYIDTMGQLSPDTPGVEMLHSFVGTVMGDRFLIMSAGTLDAIQQPILNAISNGADLIVVDALIGLQGPERPSGEATFARSLGVLVRTLNPSLEGSNTALVFVNTSRTASGAALPTPGGVAFAHQMCRRLALTPGAVEDGEHEIQVRNVKDRMTAAQGKTASFKIREGLVVGPSTKKQKEVKAPSRFDREDPI